MNSNLHRNNNNMINNTEDENLAVHVSVCQERYKALDRRLDAIEAKVEVIHTEISTGNKSMIRVIIGSTGTIVAGLLSTIVVLLMNLGG
jgi:tetrahydromethanopterin S-methyltransferase subunit G